MRYFIFLLLLFINIQLSIAQWSYKNAIVLNIGKSVGIRFKKCDTAQCFELNYTMMVHEQKKDPQTNKYYSMYHINNGADFTFILKNGDKVIAHACGNYEGDVRKDSFKTNSSELHIVYLFSFAFVNYSITESQMKALLNSKLKRVSFTVFENNTNNPVKFKFRIKHRRRKYVQKLITRYTDSSK